MAQHTAYVSTLFHNQDNADKVTVAFTMGVNALKRGHTATIILMADAVTLGQPNATDGIDIGAPFEPVSDLMKQFLDNNGQVAVCRSCMVHNGFSDEDMDQRFPIITAPDVIDLLMGAQGSLQVS